MRIELEKLGPAGADFARYLAHLEPELRALQQTARAGLFPGLEEGIDELLTKGPQVSRIIADLSDGLGDLAADAGGSLAGEDWREFFDYVETDARPTLEAFARATGNVALGLANMLVAFAPATRDFTGGLEDATKAFADWSAGLDENQSFQSLVDYVRQSGPEVVQFLGAMANAFAGLLEAAAPFGSAVLPVLTQLARVFATVAQSPVGPLLYAAAGGLIAINRAAKLYNGTAVALNRNFALLGVEATTLRGKLTALGTMGGIAAVGVGTLLDNLSTMDSMSRSSDAAQAYVDSFEDLSDSLSASNLGKYAEDLGINLARLTDDLAANGEQGEYVQRVMQQLKDDTEGAGNAFQEFLGLDLPFYEGNALQSKRALEDLDSIISQMGGHALGTTNAFDDAIDTFVATATAAQDLSGALAELSGWFDKREAIRSYRESIAELRKSLKNGFSREDAANLDTIGRNMIQVAQSIKDPDLQRDFLAGARASLHGLADDVGPKAEAAIERVINKLDSQGLTKPPAIELSADDRRAMQVLNPLSANLDRLGKRVATPSVNVDPGNSFEILGGIQSRLARIVSKTITLTVNQVGGAIPGFASGGPVPPIGTVGLCGTTPFHLLEEAA